MRVLSSAKTARSLDENPRAMHASFRARGVGSFPPSPATVDVAHCRRRFATNSRPEESLQKISYAYTVLGSHDDNHSSEKKTHRIASRNRIDPRFSVDISIDDGFCLIFSLSIGPSVGRSVPACVFLRAFFVTDDDANDDDGDDDGDDDRDDDARDDAREKKRKRKRKKKR